MPRLNIEEGFWKDGRLYRLVVLLKDHDKAIGMCIRAFSLAQQYWFKDKSLIPEKTWFEYGLSEDLITVGLAEKREGGIYVDGSEEHFQWYFDGIEQRREAGRTGGRVSAQRERDEKGRLLPKEVQANPSGRLDVVQANPSETKPSSSSSSSYKELKKEEEEKSTAAIVSEFMKKITPEMRNLWIATFKDNEWINQEVRRCEVYCLAHPQPNRNVVGYLNSWLHRAWETKKVVDKGNTSSKTKTLSLAPIGPPKELLKPFPETNPEVSKLMDQFRNKSSIASMTTAIGGNHG